MNGSPVATSNACLPPETEADAEEELFHDKQFKTSIHRPKMGWLSDADYLLEFPDGILVLNPDARECRTCPLREVSLSVLCKQVLIHT